MNTNRFLQLLEHKRGDVRPLIDNTFRNRVITEAIDFSKPYITITQRKGQNVWDVTGFVSFAVKKADVAIQEIINYIGNWFVNNNIQVVNMAAVRITGGASNYIKGPMTADVRNTSGDNPFLTAPAIKSGNTLSGESRRSENVGYATNRANAIKEGLIKYFKLAPGAVPEIYARIYDTGGVVDSQRDESKYPVPGQQATFQLVINGRIPVNPESAFKRTTSSRTSELPEYYGNEKVNVGGSTREVCRILTRNDRLTLHTSLPQYGLEPFNASIKKKADGSGWEIFNKDGKPFTEAQWIWIYYYMKDTEAKYKGGECSQWLTNIPEYIKTTDFSKVNFGAESSAQEYIHSKDKQAGAV